MSKTLKTLIMANSKPIRAALELEKLQTFLFHFDLFHAKFEKLVHVQQANTFGKETVGVSERKLP